MDKGIDKILGKDYMERIKENGFIDVKDNKGDLKYPVPCDRREFVATPCNRYACSMPSIAKSCRVFTVHGSEDEIAPLGDAFEFANIIHNYKLHIVEGADHVFDNHQSELVELVVNFIRESLQEEIRCSYMHPSIMMYPSL
ncbi:uncharacterized protein LOC113326222 [Papaver somniferum]|uniref:uncharacterized protein LOC113326222 n=1 Tax=Papaver somniferum TaxID=3469 RepID=UPI000E6F4E3E|nr:uncharacterized protein LOC113326222 [Papaver somniferum]